MLLNYRANGAHQWAQAPVLIFLQSSPRLVILILPLEGLEICSFLLPDV